MSASWEVAGECFPQAKSVRMGIARLSRVLLVLGATLGVAAVVALALDLRVNIPDWMIKVAMIKLALAGSVGLFVGGAILGRHANRQALLRANEARVLSEASTGLGPPLPDGDRVRAHPDQQND